MEDYIPWKIMIDDKIKLIVYTNNLLINNM